MSANLIESLLFGHEKGSFTGATGRQQGYFEQADRGTIFLDEITEMALDHQVRLLRVLETSKVQRLGAKELLDVNVRVIAATNRDPTEAVEEGYLREDLFYRLEVFPIVIPPLRERDEEDLRLLAEKFVEDFNER